MSQRLCLLASAVGEQAFHTALSFSEPFTLTVTSYAAAQHVDTVLDDAFSCCCGWCSRGPIAAR